ncbi:MAG TPA: AI-2E family transporter [Rhodobacteraceae bacterium]|nr:AI-2E family transporter [Paracoccaceae bacterium]
MALPVRDQVRYWSIAAAVFFAVLWLLGDVMLPFILGGAIAYCLDPIADRLERLGLSRIMATVTITVFAALAFIFVALLIVPTLVEQLVGLVNAAPEIIGNLKSFLSERFPAALDSDSQLSQSLAALSEMISSKGGALLESILSSAASLINIIVLVVLVPVITFYWLMDWDRMTTAIDNLLPRDHAPTIRKLAGDIDRTLSAFIRGQGTVMLILGTFYGVALMLVGLQFGLAIGFVAGLISFIPYVGAIVGGGLAFGVALFQFWGEWQWIAAVVAVFFAGQFLEGNILTPKLVGSSIGLHPVWLIFALSAFGTLFGFVGMLVAVPVAAALGVIVRFAIDRYQASRLYQGVSGKAEE